MSTILWVRDEGLFTDSCHMNWMDGKVYKSYSSKIYKDSKGEFVYTYTGTLSAVNKESIDERIREWLHDNKNSFTVGPKDLVSVNGDNLFRGDGVIMLKDGTTWIFTDKGGTLIIDQLDYWGSGSGGAFAESYFEIYGDPIRALEETKKIDPLTDGDINAFYLEEFNKEK